MLTYYTTLTVLGALPAAEAGDPDTPFYAHNQNSISNSNSSSNSDDNDRNLPTNIVPTKIA